MGLDPPQKSLCRALFSFPPLLHITARCSSNAVCPARGTAVSLSFATRFLPCRLARMTMRGTRAVTRLGSKCSRSLGCQLTRLG